MKLKLNKYFGDKAFYKMLIAVTVPIMIQNGITNLVNLLDNIMVGRLGTEQKSGVSIVNQCLFIYMLVVFGATAGAGIFTAQYYGSGDTEGIRNTFRIKVIVNAAVAIISIILFAIFDEELVKLFLTAENSEGDIELTLGCAKNYLAIMLIGLVPHAVSFAYSSTMRETGDTVTPMVSSLMAVATNFVLNLILIFGLLGVPALGVSGAAIATVVSRFVEFFIVVFKMHRHPEKYPYAVGALRSFKIPKELIKKISKTGIPLMANELFWSLSVTIRNQAYSTRGLEAVAAQNMTQTFFNFITVIYMALSTAISIIVGARLGAGEIEVAKDYNRKILTFTMLVSLGLSGVLCVAAPFYPMIYNTSDAAKELCTYFLFICAALLPFSAFAHASYFTLRTGGKIFITIIMDSLYMWITVVPCSLILANFTSLPIEILYPICQSIELLKIVIASIFLLKGNWAARIIDDNSGAKEAVLIEEENT